MVVVGVVIIRLIEISQVVKAAVHALAGVEALEFTILIKSILVVNRLWLKRRILLRLQFWIHVVVHISINNLRHLDIIILETHLWWLLLLLFFFFELLLLLLRLLHLLLLRLRLFVEIEPCKRFASFPYVFVDVFLWQKVLPDHGHGLSVFHYLFHA